MAFVLEDAATEPGGYGTQSMSDTPARNGGLPFDPTGTSPLATAGRPPGAATEPACPEAGETMVSPRDGRLRLVRFDPQTGLPVAYPYWERIPR